MDKKQIFNEFIHYLNNDIQSKDFLTYQEQDEWKDYLERIINNYTKGKDKEIARLNNCINKIQDIINEYDFSIKEEWYVEPENWELDENCYASSYIDLHKICLILKELKEEGK